MKQASLTIIVPTLNRPGHLLKSLPSILSQTLKPKEIIVVDQSDDTKSREYFESLDTGAIRKTYVYQKRKSLILARNNGLRALTDTDFAMFLDDDAVLFPEFVEKIMARFDADARHEFGGGMGTVVPFEYKARLFQKIFFIAHHGSGKFLPTGCPTFPHWKKEYCETEFLSGGNSTYRKEVILANLFDERLVGYGHGDDVDVSYRISRKYKNFYEPAAGCSHDEGSPGRDPGFKHRKALLQNLFYLLEKNVGTELWRKALFFWMILGYAIDDLVNFRKGALAGCFAAAWNILRGNIDTVEGYGAFKRSLKA